LTITVNNAVVNDTVIPQMSLSVLYVTTALWRLIEVPALLEALLVDDAEALRSRELSENEAEAAEG